MVSPMLLESDTDQILPFIICSRNKGSRQHNDDCTSNQVQIGHFHNWMKEVLINQRLTEVWATSITKYIYANQALELITAHYKMLKIAHVMRSIIKLL